MKYTKEQYKRAVEIACDLLNDGSLYDVDFDVLLPHLIQKYGVVVSGYNYQKFILENLDRFSDDEEVRHNAIERLGW